MPHIGWVPLDGHVEAWPPQAEPALLSRTRLGPSFPSDWNTIFLSNPKLLRFAVQCNPSGSRRSIDVVVREERVAIAAPATPRFEAGNAQRRVRTARGSKTSSSIPLDRIRGAEIDKSDGLVARPAPMQMLGLKKVPLRVAKPVSLRKTTRPVKTRALFNFGRTKARETVVPAPDYTLSVTLLAAAAGLAWHGDYVPAAPVGLIGAFLAFQTSRVRFVFGPDALEVRVGDALEETDNRIVGGANKWKYSSFVNWEFWFPSFPVLVYFKETQTKPEGQIHFFPILFNGKQLYDVMVERCGSTQGSAPKPKKTPTKN